MAQAQAPVYTLRNACLGFGAKRLFDGLDLYIGKNDRICLIGRNGAGKSTLLKVVAGLVAPDEAETFVKPNLKIAYMPQDDDFTGFATLRDVVASGEADGADAYLVDKFIGLFDVNGALDPATASGGERKKAALARAFIGDPDIVLLDEPTNHLDVFTIEKLEEYLEKFRGAAVIVSHDRAFLKHTSREMVWLDRGLTHFSDKGFENFDDWCEELLRAAETEQYRLNKKIETETQWLHKGVTARRKRNQGRLRRLIALREERKNFLKPQGSVSMTASEADIRTKLIIQAKNVSKSFDGRPVVKDFSIRIMRGDRIGVIGKNGAGKTTLIKLLTGRLEADGGSLTISKTLQEICFDQNRASLDLTKTIRQTLCPDGNDHVFVNGESRHVFTYMRDFLFDEAAANMPVSSLSGGEKNRLILAVLLTKPSNFLVLDEPTNDLDTDTLDLLEQLLDSYKGTVLIVSHDREFLDNTATSLLYMKGDGSVTEYVGACSDVLKKIRQSEEEKAQKAQQSAKKTEPVRAPSAAKPARLSYNEKRRLEMLPAEIDALESDIKRLEETLNDAGLYAANPEKFAQTATLLEQSRQQLDGKETEWLELNLKAEEAAKK